MNGFNDNRNCNKCKCFKDMKKSNRDKVIAGVCGALGEYTPIPSWMWRAIFLCSAIFGGIGVFVYVILWLCMPSDNC